MHFFGGSFGWIWCCFSEGQTLKTSLFVDYLKNRYIEIMLFDTFSFENAENEYYLHLTPCYVKHEKNVYI